ncbi:MAG: RluA family pseudouridine synthase [Acidimicrobiales bacterium]
MTNDRVDIIPSALAGERIDRVVALLCGVSRTEASELVTSGKVRVGDEPVRGRAVRVAEGDVVEVDVPERPAPKVLEPDATVAVDVVHADDDVIVIDKRPGVVVHPGAGNARRTLVHGLLARFPEIAAVGAPGRPGVVHRLDKDTSGLLLVARTPAAHAGLVRQLSARSVTRRYWALVWGWFDAPRGLVEAPIGRSARSPTKMAVATGGREARTRYEVVRSYNDPVEVSRLRCELETGRTHQIRVHLAAIDHPVVGDRGYRGARESFPVPRMFLHAAHLTFAHPVTGRAMSFDSPLPADLDEVLARLR